MNTLQEKWVKALESGKYPQTTEHLRTDEGYCCLGVACEVMIQEGVPGLSREEGENFYSYKGNSLDDALDYGLSKIIGINGPGGRIRHARHEFLTNLNDDERMSFSEIAKFIRENEDTVFVKPKEVMCTTNSDQPAEKT